jgi:polyisoprenyl-teichoic acid--peptidoglycan teichoic acid transferase
MKLEKTILSICALACLLTMGLTWNSSVGRALIEEQPIRGILVGSDYDDHARHSDTLMVISYDPKTRFLDVLSIPRDTMVSLPTMPSVRRINEVFTYEFRHSGRSFDIASTSLKQVVQTLLSSGSARGFDIPYYYTVDYKGFRSFIDAIGGVPVTVTEPMHYDDNWGKLHIHFDPGHYVLNGKQALEYVRFRGKSADQGRVRRQQIFLREVLKRMKRPAILWRLPKYAGEILAGFHTNLSPWDMAMLLLEGRRVNRKNIRLMSLPGAPKGNLLKMDVAATQQIVAMMEAPLEGTRAIRSKTSDASWRGRATVQVWNASNRLSAAREVMIYLRQSGFDVVKIGNFSTRQSQTLVVDRSGDLRPAQAVADAMRRYGNAEVVSRPMRSLHVDVDVVIGNDAAHYEKN